MKILGWILTIVGGFLSFGALIQLTDSRHGDVYVPAALSVFAVFVIGLIILNRQKKK